MKYGELVRDIRKHFGLTQKEFSPIIGTTQGSMALVETGKQERYTKQIEDNLIKWLMVPRLNFEIALESNQKDAIDFVLWHRDEFDELNKYAVEVYKEFNSLTNEIVYALDKKGLKLRTKIVKDEIDKGTYLYQVFSLAEEKSETKIVVSYIDTIGSRALLNDVVKEKQAEVIKLCYLDPSIKRVYVPYYADNPEELLERRMEAKWHVQHKRKIEELEVVAKEVKEIVKEISEWYSNGN